MPYCCVTTCKNHSRSINLANSGVSYHRFPTDPKVKEIWVKAAGRSHTSWTPLKNSTICSIHFDDDVKYNLGKYNRVPDDAVPTLNLPGQMSVATFPIEDSKEEERTNNKSESEQSEVDSDGSGDLIEEMPTRKGQIALDRAKKLIRKRTLLVKKLREQNRRANKKVLLQNRILNDLMEMFSLKKEDIAVLKNEIIKSGNLETQ